jgi:hypothetical protein
LHDAFQVPPLIERQRFGSIFGKATEGTQGPAA